jgi:hypothetical protein
VAEASGHELYLGIFVVVYCGELDTAYSVGCYFI